METAGGKGFKDRCALCGVSWCRYRRYGHFGADLGRLGLITAYADEFADRPEEVEGSSQIQVGNADGSDAEKEDTKGSDTAQWMGQVETDETKLQAAKDAYNLANVYFLYQGTAMRPTDGSMAAMNFSKSVEQLQKADDAIAEGTAQIA